LKIEKLDRSPYYIPKFVKAFFYANCFAFIPFHPSYPSQYITC